MDFVREYWPFLLIAAFFGYRFYSGKKIRGELPMLLKENPYLLDVRSKQEVASGGVPNAVNIPLQELKPNSLNVAKDKLILVFCASGARSAAAVGMLKGAGFTNVRNAGAWTNLLV